MISEENSIKPTRINKKMSKTNHLTCNIFGIFLRKLTILPLPMTIFQFNISGTVQSFLFVSS